MRRPLARIGVVVTRPAHQANELAKLLEAEGARIIRFPVLAIEPPEDESRVLETLARVGEFHMVIFVSANAAEYGLRFLTIVGGLSPRTVVAAVGKATAGALTKLGVRVDLAPRRRYDSESLLALSSFQAEAVQDKRVLIFRGQGGREHLAETLRVRGALVEYVEVYRRVRPRVSPERLLEPLARGEVNVIVVTSGEGLRNLLEMVGDEGRGQLLQTPLLVVSERLADLAQSAGFRPKPVVASCAADPDIVATLVRWRTRRTRVVRGVP